MNKYLLIFCIYVFVGFICIAICAWLFPSIDKGIIIAATFGGFLYKVCHEWFNDHYKIIKRNGKNKNK